MASILQKVLKNQSTTRIISGFTKPILPPQILSHLTEIDPPHHHKVDPFPFLGLPRTMDSNPSQSSLFYPSFPLGGFLNPISSTGFAQCGAEYVVPDGSRTIWADSVKKKRKRKMNKHKLKKLRKRLRRKS